MTVPRFAESGMRRVADMVRELVPSLRNRLSKEDEVLALQLRGNAPLYEAIIGIIKARIGGRQMVPEPSDPLVAKSMLARDRELQWLLGKLEFLYHSSPSNLEQDDREQPA